MKIINKSYQFILSRFLSIIVLFQLTTAQKSGFHTTTNSSFSGSVFAYNASDTSNVRKTPSPEPINHPCDELLNKTSEAFGDFYKCSIHYARPYRFCERCSRVYTKAIRVYQEIQFSGRNTSVFNCKKYLLESDNSPVIQSAIANILSIWEHAYCDNCFGKSLTSAYANNTDLSNSTLKFLLLYQNLTDCISDCILHDQPDSICKSCHEMYKALNEHFNEIEKVSSSTVCMDIMDRMNYTRIQWSKNFNCSTKRPKDTELISSIVVVSIAVPAIYYISAYVASKGVKKFREKLARSPNARSSIDGRHGSYESIDETPGINTPSVSSSSRT